MARALATDEERRGLTLADAHIDIRETDEGEKRFVGHAAVFDVRTNIGNPLKWGFYEQVSPGAFTKTISEGDARMLIDHDSFYVVSRTSAGTLRLAQDAVGLSTDSALDDDLSYVRDLKANLRNRNITGMSFGFFVVKDDWSSESVETNDGNTAEVEIRTIQEVRLVEVSAVTFPAYDQTDAGMRSVRSALRARGDADAIKRRAEFRPELATLLDELPGARTVIPLGSNAPTNAPSSEPAETTRDDEQHDLTSTEAPEPAASTRIAPTERELVAARMKALSGLVRRPAA